MAQREQMVFAETYLSLKKAVKRKAYESDSDSSIDQQTTNRGKKLKKNAGYARQGLLAPPTYLPASKEVIDHAGYRREIINRNPPLVDDEGYDIESGDDEEHIRVAAAAAAEENPYTDVRLEHILAPLTSLSELATHQTLSRPYTSKALTELAGQAGNWMHEENDVLWKVKPLLTRLVGDHTWASCGLMVADEDADLFEDDFATRFRSRAVNGPTTAESQRTATPKINGDSNRPVDGDTDNSGAAGPGEDQPTTDSDVSMVDADPNEGEATSKDSAQELQTVNGEKTPASLSNESEKKTSEKATDDDPPAQSNPPDLPHQTDSISNGIGKKGSDKPPLKDPKKKSSTADQPAERSADDGSADTPALPSQAPGSRALVPLNHGRRGDSPTPDLLDEQPIHPLFLAPRGARAERDFGLAPNEAEDLRRLLQLWVQKQEEVARGTKKLYDGLLKADRLRKEVLKWSKAEAHCGANRDMSDGEDWYDKEEWALAEDLKKGHDEEEEDAQQTQKKTRNRR